MSEKPLLRSRSPQNPQNVLLERVATSPSEVAVAVGVARQAGREWSRLPATARADALNAGAARLAALSQELEDLVVVEVGKPRLEARGEVARTIAILRYFAQQVLDPIGDVLPPSAGGFLFTVRRPRGVAGLITPWNFPLAIPMWKAAPALAAGNAVVLKPSTEAMATGLRLGELLAESLPAGLFSVLPGGAETATAILNEVDVVSFTGSTVVGRQVASSCGSRGIPVQAEMGGQNAAIVLRDADLPATARMLTRAATDFAGQKCTATRRIITVGDPGPTVAALREALDQVVVGDPDDLTTTVGPVINEESLSTLNTAYEDAASAGGELLQPQATPGLDGFFGTPSYVLGIPPSHVLAQEETFGPMALVLSAPDVDAAIEMANTVKYGLVASVHGGDIRDVLKVVEGIETGLVKVNAPTTGVDFWAPFGGEKASSVGPREQGKSAMDFYSSTRTVTFTG